MLQICLYWFVEMYVWLHVLWEKMMRVAASNLFCKSSTAERAQSENISISLLSFYSGNTRDRTGARRPLAPIQCNTAVILIDNLR